MNHGTNAGYLAHFHKQTGDRTPCEPCKKAHAQYRADLRIRQYVTRSNIRVPAVGTRRRIRALNRMGWRNVDIAREAGVSVHWVSLIGRSKYVTQASHRAIAEAYERLSARRGPSQRTAERALASGYAPPLAWDDIDDPKCKPQGHLRPSEIKKLVNGKA